MYTHRSSQRDTYIHISVVSDIPSKAPTLREKVRPSIPAYDRLPGKKGSYKLVDELGNGGMSLVCLGEQEPCGTQVAVKFSLLDNNSYIAREYSALDAVDHPNIVKVLDGGVVEGRYFLVMELLRGNTLRSVIYSHNTIEPDVAIEIILQTLNGLEAVHRASILHCDLKPDNIFMADSVDSMTVKLIDFGLARHLEESPTGRGFGTPGYMAPEQAVGDAIDQRADIYSVGAVLYNMLTGRELFSGSTEEKMEQTVSSYPPPPSSIVQGIPPLLDSLVMRSLDKDPERRFRHVTEFRQNLEHVLEAITQN
jgi:serine/threonine-protein kinase